MAGLYFAWSAGARHRWSTGAHCENLPLPAQTIRGTAHFLLRIGGGEFLFAGRVACGRECRISLARIVSNLDPDDHCYFCGDDGIRTTGPGGENNSDRFRHRLRRTDARASYRVWHWGPGFGKAISREKISQGKARAEAG